MFDGEAKLLAQREHASIVVQDVADHAGEPATAGMVDQTPHHDAAESAPLPRVVDHRGEFATAAVRIADVARYRDFDFTAAFIAHRDKRHFTVIIDLCKTHQHGRRQLAHRTHESKI